MLAVLRWSRERSDVLVATLAYRPVVASADCADPDRRAGRRLLRRGPPEPAHRHQRARTSCPVHSERRAAPRRGGVAGPDLAAPLPGRDTRRLRRRGERLWSARLRERRGPGRAADRAVLARAGGERAPGRGR